MNAVLLDRVAGALAHRRLARRALVQHSSPSSARRALLFVAAQAGFVDGPRVMANMAVDSWLPHRFAALSERLSMQNGVAPHGRHVDRGAPLHARRRREARRHVLDQRVPHVLALEPRHEPLLDHSTARSTRTGCDTCRSTSSGSALCVTILIVTCFEKFADGRVAHARRSPGSSSRSASRSSATTAWSSAPSATSTWSSPTRSRPGDGEGHDVATDEPVPPIDPTKPVAILFVGGYGGLGRHALLTLLRMFPGHFKGVVFCSIAIIDSGNFKGVDEVHELEARTPRAARQVREATPRRSASPRRARSRRGSRSPSRPRSSATELDRASTRRGSSSPGSSSSTRTRRSTRILHNETAFLIQRRLQHAGVPMVVLPVRLTLKNGPRLSAPSMAKERDVA